MAYAPSPRPAYDEPTHIPYSSVTRHLWGDDEAGRVSDWIYVSSGGIHQLVFGLPPGGRFGHSDSYRTIFAADEVLYVLSGVMLIANPQTGEVHRVLPGEAAFFRRDTWHHVINHSSDELRVLEYFAPPPSQGTSGSYAQTKPYLEQSRYTQDELLGSWPAARDSILAADTITRIGTADRRVRLEGPDQGLVVGLLASTEHLTVGVAELLPGARGDVERHPGEEALYVTRGRLNIHVPEGCSNGSWLELTPGDGFFVPAGVAHQYYNWSAEPVEFVFGVAPHYVEGQRDVSGQDTSGSSG
ncbi:MAG TPA: cupin domain-containing protein [Actinopolymorphaceae bacterium]